MSAKLHFKFHCKLRTVRATPPGAPSSKFWMKKIENMLDWRPAFLHRIMGLAKGTAKMV
jgi:hypothetical protein